MRSSWLLASVPCTGTASGPSGCDVAMGTPRMGLDGVTGGAGGAARADHSDSAERPGRVPRCRTRRPATTSWRSPSPTRSGPSRTRPPSWRPPRTRGTCRTPTTRSGSCCATGATSTWRSPSCAPPGAGPTAPGTTTAVRTCGPRLGAALAFRGRTGAGLRELDAAASRATPGGPVHSKVLMRRANVLAYAGRHDAALDDLARAVRDFRRTGDDVWEARALNLRAFVRIARAQFSEAEPDLDRALELLSRRGAAASRCWSSGTTWRSCGTSAATSRARWPPSPRSRRPTATTASHAYLELVLDRAHVLLVAGLSDEALAVVEDAAGWVDAPPARPCRPARHARGGPAGGGPAGRGARRPLGRPAALYVRQGRDWWRTRADLVALQARIELGRGSRRAAVALAGVAGRGPHRGRRAGPPAGRSRARPDGPRGRRRRTSRAPPRDGATAAP